MVRFTGIRNSSGLWGFRSHVTNRMNLVRSSVHSLVSRTHFGTRLKITRESQVVIRIACEAYGLHVQSVVKSVQVIAATVNISHQRIYMTRFLWLSNFHADNVQRYHVRNVFLIFVDIWVPRELVL